MSCDKQRCNVRVDREDVSHVADLVNVSALLRVQLSRAVDSGRCQDRAQGRHFERC